MRCLTSVSLAILAALTLSISASAADYVLPTKKEMQTYSVLRSQVRKQHGVRAPGRNIRRYGIRTETGHVRLASASEVARSIRTFRRWLAPPAPAARRGDRISANPAYAGGRWAIPAPIVMCESGGNYRAENLSNPAHPSGAYQIIDDTWKRNGGSTPTAAQASPAEQDRVAARIWNGGAGRGQWAC
jgi:hypothetical protein